MNTLLLTLANMGVNLDDVADVVNNCIPQLIFFGVVVAAAIIVLIAMAVNKKLAKPTKFMVRAQSGLAVLLAFGIMLNLVAFGPMSTMLDLVTGNGTITEESGAEANALCTEIAEEGIVLLQNDDNELPLASGSNLNVFGFCRPCLRRHRRRRDLCRPSHRQPAGWPAQRGHQHQHRAERFLHRLLRRAPGAGLQQP